MEKIERVLKSGGSDESEVEKDRYIYNDKSFFLMLEFCGKIACLAT